MTRNPTDPAPHAGAPLSGIPDGAAVVSALGSMAGSGAGAAFYEKEIAHRDETIAEYRDIAFKQREWLAEFKANENALLAERDAARTEAAIAEKFHAVAVAERNEARAEASQNLTHGLRWKDKADAAEAERDALRAQLTRMVACFDRGSPEHEAFWTAAAEDDAYSDTPEAVRETSSAGVQRRTVAAARAALGKAGAA